jgi:large subunit ribosomal protein L21
MSKIAVIETGGKQYVVAPGNVIKVEKLPHKAGDKFAFDKILFVADGDNVSLGKPYYDAKVDAQLVAQDRLDKVITRKYHNKTRYRNKRGHRQHVSVVRILDIK